MNRDKQIDEMAKVIQNTWIPINCGNATIGDRRIHEDDANRVAYDLYTAGYRKASEVAREIFEEIDRMIYRLLNDRHYIVGDMCYEVEELKKKYTEGCDGQTD